MENKKFEMPVLEIIFFEAEDVLTTSAPETPDIDIGDM